MTPKPDRRNHVDIIKRNIDSTRHNMELADELLAETSDPRLKEELEDKNERRRHALEDMRKDIKDDAAYQEANKQK